MAAARQRGPGDVHLDIRLAGETRDLLAAAAAKDGRTISECARRVLSEWARSLLGSRHSAVVAERAAAKSRP